MCVPVVLPVIQWNFSRTAVHNGDTFKGSCSATTNPRPDVRIITSGCYCQQNNAYIENYTTTVVFTIPSVTEHCEQNVYCLTSSKTYSVLKAEKFLVIVGKCIITW